MVGWMTPLYLLHSKTIVRTFCKVFGNKAKIPSVKPQPAIKVVAFSCGKLVVDRLKGKQAGYI